MEWDTDAKAFLDSMLAEMPFFIRAQAKTATVEKAQEVAGDRDAERVAKDDVVAAMVLITPEAMREPLKAMLTKRGVDLARFEKHFR